VSAVGGASRMEARLAHLAHVAECQICGEVCGTVEQVMAEEAPCRFVALMGAAARDWIYVNSCQRGRALLDLYTDALKRRLQ